MQVCLSHQLNNDKLKHPNMKTFKNQHAAITRKQFKLFIFLMAAGSLLTCLMAFGANAQTVAVLTKKEITSNTVPVVKKDESYFEKGIKAFEMNDDKAAIRFFTMAISENANDAVSLNKRGCAYARLRQWKKAKSDFTAAITRDSTHAEFYYHRGLAENKTNRLNNSIADCSKAIELNPKMPEAYLVRGISKVLQGDESSSMTDFSVALGLKPDYAEAYYNIGLNYFELHDDANAKKYLLEAKKLGFENPELENYLKK